MRGDGLAQRLAGWLIGRAGRHLPAAARAEREREWTAELPAILADPDVRSGLLRSARALRFAVGTIRTARREHGVFRGQLTGADARSAGVRLFGCASLWLAAVCLVRLGAVLHIPRAARHLDRAGRPDRRRCRAVRAGPAHQAGPLAVPARLRSAAPAT